MAKLTVGNVEPNDPVRRKQLLNWAVGMRMLASRGLKLAPGQEFNQKGRVYDVIDAKTGEPRGKRRLRLSVKLGRWEVEKVE